jgi:hypothetical protein
VEGCKKEEESEEGRKKKRGREGRKEEEGREERKEGEREGGKENMGSEVLDSPIWQCGPLLNCLCSLPAVFLSSTHSTFLESPSSWGLHYIFKLHSHSFMHHPLKGCL